MSHGDEVVKMPKQFGNVVTSEQGVIAALECAVRQFYGFEYHS